VFLDKDGTLVVDVPYNVDPAHLRLTSGCGPALRRLRGAGYLLIGVSNQSGLARGLFDIPALDRSITCLQGLLREEGAELDAFYFCPHLPGAAVQAYAQYCSCRKPAAGLLFSAAVQHRIDLQRSWLVGDILDDVEAGRRAGCHTVLVGENEREWRDGPLRRPDAIARSLEDAAAAILEAVGGPGPGGGA
jgi:D,D-heptose 1,7-bisphosphate phosphatase